ncbi:MAG TPA: hypothetical protein ENK82_06855 [Campylobacterales bacterium]|nr:hypothetical protein [Campylobacterales bacterium]HHS93050.1 hypothetical protein [Campylobacterales bacterium]
MKHIYILLAPLLLAAEVQLEDIEVTETESFEEEGSFLYQKEGYMPNAPMQKQITTQEALKVAGTNGDPVKALKSFAGIVSTNNDEGSELYIHGSKPRETSYSINHLPLGYLFHGGGLHSVIAPEATAQIDAYLGGFDTTYDAMGAVIDITPNYPKGSNKGRVHIGMYDADFAYDAKLGEDTSLFISGRRSYFDLIASKVIDTLDEDERDPEKKTTFTLFPQYYDANMILSHTIGNHTFSLEAITAQDEMKLNSTINQTKDPVANGKINTKSNFATIGARWLYSGDNYESMTLLSHMNTQFDGQFFDADYFVKSESNQLSLYHETVFDLENHKPLIGMELTQDRSPVKAHISNPPSSDDFEPLVTDQEVVDLDKTFEAKSYALFAQDIWSITPTDHVRYGVRAWDTDFQNFGSGVDPRFAYVHDFSKSLSTSFAVGKYSQFPEIANVIEGFGNPRINTIEHANHYTMNITKKFDKASSLVVEPYYKTFKNLAIRDDVNKYEAVGEGEAYGFDVTYRTKLNKFDMIFAYTYVKAKRQLNTNSTKQYTFEGDIPHTLQVNSSYKFNNNWRVSSLFRFNSGRPYTPIMGTEDAVYQGEAYKRPLYGNPYSNRMPNNFDLDVQISKTYKYANSSLEVAFELMNVNALIKPNIEEYRYDDNYVRDGEYEQMGFLPAFHVTYRF